MDAKLKASINDWLNDQTIPIYRDGINTRYDQDVDLNGDIKK